MGRVRAAFPRADILGYRKTNRQEENMKFLLAIATMAAALSAGPIPTFNHPNDLVSFPAPYTPAPIELRFEDLQAEFPQNRVSYGGGLVGYFSQWPQVAPIWTTPAVEWVPAEEPEAQFIHPLPPPTHPGQPAETPEPSTFALLALGLFCIAAGWHKKI